MIHSPKHTAVRLRMRKLTVYDDRSFNGVTAYAALTTAYEKNFRYLLNQAVFNSFVLYKKNDGALSQINFRIQLIERIVVKEQMHSLNSCNQTAKTNENVICLSGRHFPSYIPNT